MLLSLSGIVTLALLGLPLFCVLASIGLAGFHSLDAPFPGLIADVYGRLTGVEAVSLSTIPLFTFVGYLMAKAKTAERLVRMGEALLGWIPGGLALMTLWTCAFFTIFTGASGVTIVALGGLLLPELERSNYSKRFSLEVVTGSGSVGLLFPPALPLIVYGIIFAINGGHSGAGEPNPFSIDRFIFAGIVPGLVLLGILSIYCIVEGARSKVPRFPLDLKKFADALWEAKWELPIPFFIIGLMLSGLALLPEIAALTALYVFIVEVFIYKDIDIRRDLFEVARESMTLVGAIFMKIVSATILTAYFVEAGVPGKLYDWLTQYIHTQHAFLLVLNILLLLVGCLMDIFSAILVMVPLIAPAAAGYHIDPYHLGVIFLLNLEIGYLLPPAGLNLFIAAFRFNRPITHLYRAVIPFILLMMVALGLVSYIPQLTVVPKATAAQRAPERSAETALPQ